MSRRSKKNKRNLKKLKLRNSTRVFLVVLSLIIFAISSANFLKSLSKKDIKNTEEKIYTYKNEYKSDYTVNIKNNQFITDSTLPSGQTYVSDLVNSLDMNINYTYTASEKTSMKYNYKIDAVIAGSYTDNGQSYVVLNKTYNLKTSDEIETNGDIKIDENININYDKYHQEVKNFKQSMGMALDSYLYIKLTVNTATTVNHQEVKNEYVSNFSVTIGNKIAKIDSTSPDTKLGSLKQENTVKTSSLDITKLVISLVIILISLYTIYYIAFKTKKYNTKGKMMKLNYKKTIFVGFAFFLICAFWQAYDSIVPMMLVNKFGLNQTLSGVIMSLDNIIALFMLPLFGALSDKTKSKFGRRTPYVVLGTIVAACSFFCLTFADNAQLAKLNVKDGGEFYSQLFEDNYSITNAEYGAFTNTSVPKELKIKDYAANVVFNKNYDELTDDQKTEVKEWYTGINEEYLKDHAARETVYGYRGGKYFELQVEQNGKTTVYKDGEGNIVDKSYVKNAYTNLVNPALNKYAWKQTTSNPVPLVLFGLLL